MKNILLFITCIALCCASCSKKNTPAHPGEGQGYNLSGSLYFDWATDGILKMDLRTGESVSILASDVRRNGWDISRDAKQLLYATASPDHDYDANQYTNIRVSDLDVVYQFKYYPTEREDSYGLLSPDETMIAVEPTFDDGIIILNQQGDVLANLDELGETKLRINVTRHAWMPDNSLLFTIGDHIYLSNTAFTAATLIKTVDNIGYRAWDALVVSPDGKKVAFTRGGHVWMMNSDGRNLAQITGSDLHEKACTFSPDGNYLLIGTEYVNNSWYLAVIPADGRQYNVGDEDADGRVIFLYDGNIRQKGDGFAYWR
ncbi:TolB-like translocation protein [Arachidicoccus terrestris]|uniref:hypothetical protein n=1 Tax=Arachidicoccus terrestris TaxID=2875539 RepID=UPI001CC4F7C8|nr:hypothetical protein [Arachidicoccus terrestris]UAY55415.1 hypothetical protein K9M52_18745 [Arachidicoccus terrestris]